MGGIRYSDSQEKSEVKALGLFLDSSFSSATRMDTGSDRESSIDNKIRTPKIVLSI